MKYAKSTIAAVVAATCLSICQPGTLPAAEQPAETQHIGAPRAFSDVALGTGGQLSGVVQDAGGMPKPNLAVTLIQNQKVIANTVTDKQGRFAIDGVRGGTYVVASEQQFNTVCRAWAPGTAPPGANREVRLHVGPVVRGHFGGKIHSWLPSIHPVQYLHNPIAIGSIIGMAGALPIILHDDEIGGNAS